MKAAVYDIYKKEYDTDTLLDRLNFIDNLSQTSNSYLPTIYLGVLSRIIVAVVTNQVGVVSQLSKNEVGIHLIVIICSMFILIPLLFVAFIIFIPTTSICHRTLLSTNDIFLLFKEEKEIIMNKLTKSKSLKKSIKLKIL